MGAERTDGSSRMPRDSDTSGLGTSAISRRKSSIHPWVDTRFAPIYVLALPKDPEDDQLAELLESIEAFLRRVDRPYVWLTDTTRLTRSSARQRRMVAEFLGRIRHLGRMRVASAVLINNRLVHGIMTAIQWLTPYNWETKVFRDRSEALPWLKQQLHAAQVDGPLSNRQPPESLNTPSKSSDPPALG